ncbi:FAD-dependent monooxygenase [Streptomyces lydicamycinicus]|uniref:FAD-dependent monooxygenase n=1 Tax=Streptomyces lydicamycinicus TaxID=1546107 RepID=UPI0020362B38|nr:FAD-dependent monooxygenase [Streptomyces lydicamycinicus]USA00148.1 FAD-dependent monooxygenase [Streptomyces lydicamycinicus]
MVRAQCVVGADGRYSTVRRLAGIPYDRVDLFDQDVLWFKLTAGATRTVRILRAGGSPVLAYTSFPDRVQLGWTLPHRGYRKLASRGFEYVKDRIRASVPQYAEAVEEQIGGFKDLSLLDVFAGSARQWARDGLLLIGDSAHTHSPIGAQGINLAIQDAVAAHPVLCEGLRRRDLSARFLTPLVVRRQRETGKMTKLQLMQSRMMLSTGRLSGIVRPKAAMLVSRTPPTARCCGASPTATAAWRFGTTSSATPKPLPPDPVRPSCLRGEARHRGSPRPQILRPGASGV